MWDEKKVKVSLKGSLLCKPFSTQFAFCVKYGIVWGPSSGGLLGYALEADDLIKIQSYYALTEDTQDKYRLAMDRIPYRRKLHTNESDISL